MVDLKHLTDAELDYEVKLRKRDPSEMRRELKIEATRMFMQAESCSKKYPTTATHFISDDDNIHYCQYKVKRILEFLKIALNEDDEGEVKACRSRLLCYHFRISLIVNPKYVPYVQMLDKAIREALQHIANFFESRPLRAPSESSNSPILPESKKALDDLKAQNEAAQRSRTQNTDNPNPVPQPAPSPVPVPRPVPPIPIPDQAPTPEPPIPPPVPPPAPVPPPQPPLPPPVPVPRPDLPFQSPVPLLPPGPQIPPQVSYPGPWLQPPLYPPNVGDDVKDRMIDYLLNRPPPAPPAPQPTQPQWHNNHHRFVQPVHKWPFSYGGSQNITELAVFLNRVKAFADTEDMEEGYLLRGVKHLLRGRALEWYTRHYMEFNTWEDFKQEIKAEFLPPNYSQLIKRDMYWRLQGQEEKFSNYLQDIQALFEVVEPTMTHAEMYFILKNNLNPEYAAVAAASRVLSVTGLVDVCKDYENAKKFGQKNRSSQIPRSALVEPSFATPAASRNTRSNPPEYSWNRTNRQAPNRQQYVNLIDEERLDVVPVTPIPEEALSHQQATGHGDMFPVTGFENLSVQEQEVNAIRGQAPARLGQTGFQREEQRINITCWQCEQPGHTFPVCPAPKTFLFCYRCGRKGFTSRNCEDCLVRLAQALPDTNLQTMPGNGSTGFPR